MGRDKSHVWRDRARCATSVCLKTALCIHLLPLLSLQPVTMVLPRCLLISLYCPWGWSCLCSWSYSSQHLLSSLLIAAVFPSLQQEASSHCSVSHNSFTSDPWAVMIIWSQLNKRKKPKTINLLTLNMHSQEKNLKIPPPQILRNCLGKQFFRKKIWKTGLFESSEERHQIINLSIFHTSCINQPLLQSWAKSK